MNINNMKHIIMSENLEEIVVTSLKRNKNNIVCIFVLICFSFLCHGYMFFNKLPNYDEATALFSKGLSLELGRFLRPYTSFFTRGCSLPVVIGLFCTLFGIISVFYICRIFDINSYLWKFVLGCVVLAFPALTSSYTFMFVSDAYMLALCLSVISIYFMKDNRPICYLVGIALLVGSLGIYQAHFAFACMLAVMICMKKLVDDGTFFKLAIKLLVGLISAMLISQIMLKIICSIAGISGSGLFIASDMIKQVPASLLKCYMLILEMITQSSRTGVTFNKLTSIVFLFCIAIGIVMYLKKIFCRRRNWVMAIGLFLLLPIACNLLVFQMGDREMDTLMTFQYVLWLIFPLAFLGDSSSSDSRESTKEHATYNLIKISYLLVLLIAIWQFTCQSNRTYLGMDLAKTQAISYYTTLISGIKNADGYEDGMKVAIVGVEPEEKSMMNYFPYDAEIRGSMTLKRFVNMYSREEFIRYYCGFSPEWLSEEEVCDLVDEKMIEQMVTYPNDGSIMIIDDIVIVKINQLGQEIEKIG